MSIHTTQHASIWCAIKESIAGEVSMPTTTAEITLAIAALNLLLLGDVSPIEWTDGPLSAIHMFAVSALSGLMGSLISFAAFGNGSAQEQAKQSVGNFGMSVVFSPLTAWGLSKVTGIPITLVPMVAIAGVWGIGGIYFLRRNGEAFLDKVSKKAQSEVDHALGTNADGTAKKDSQAT